MDQRPSRFGQAGGKQPHLRDVCLSERACRMCLAAAASDARFCMEHDAQARLARSVVPGRDAWFLRACGSLLVRLQDRLAVDDGDRHGCAGIFAAAMETVSDRGGPYPGSGGICYSICPVLSAWIHKCRGPIRLLESGSAYI